NLQDIYPLTPLQEGMLFHYLLDKEKYRDRYIYQFVITLKGTIDIPALEKSFQKLVDTYDILRTVFRFEGVHKPLQIVLKQRTIRLQVQGLGGDISNLTDNEKEQWLENFINKDKCQPFDLSRDLPLRVTLIKIDSSTSVLCWSLHHIFVDGWSVGILFRELIRLYESLTKNAGLNQSITLPSTFPFRRYMEWLARRDRDQDRYYWQKYLQGYETHVILPEMEKNTNTIEDEFQESEFVLTLQPELVSKLQNLVSSLQITANILFQCTWGILLQRYNNTRDVVYGVVVSGRPPELPGVEDMVGLFINTIPLRVESHSDMPFSRLLQQIKKDSALSKAHEHTSLAEIQAQSLLKEKLIGHIMVFENYPLKEEVINWGANRTLGFVVQKVKMSGQAHYPFYIVVIPEGNLRVMFKYDARVYNEQFLQKMGMHFKALLCQAAENPEILIGDLEILSDQERNQLIYEFNRTAAEYPRDKTLQQLWAGQVERGPDRPAVTAPAGGSQDSRYTINVTFKQLHNNSQQLAGLLHKEGVEPGAVVALLVEPSVEMMVGIWGILLAGAAYLPIDTGLPPHRIDYILADSAVNILVTTRGLFQTSMKLRDMDVKKIFLDSLLPSSDLIMLPVLPVHPVLMGSTLANSPVYILYTSGTTGRPKGVVLMHENLVNYVAWFCRVSGLTGEDRTLLVSSYAFDLGYTAVYPCLLKGGQLHLVKRETYLWPEEFWNYLRAHRITYLKATPTFFQLIINSPSFSAENGRSLRLIVLGGEAINAALVEKFFQVCKHLPQIMNHYGPTETTVGTVAGFVNARDFENFRKHPVIGQPIDNARVYILDHNNQLVMIGQPGEICITGAGISPGYLNKPELTAEKFRPLIPLMAQMTQMKNKNCAHGADFHHSAFELPRIQQSRFYRTGDLGRWLPAGPPAGGAPGGVIQFLGRVDRQIKIRGFRVEPNEIENHLRQLDEIEDAVVVAKETGGEKSLWAYVVPAAAVKKSFDIPGVIAALEKQLPSYMLPAGIIAIKSIPLTPNGKIDQQALPAPTPGSEQRGIEQIYMPPRDENEEKMQAIWADVLGIDKNKISMNSNFFHLGGHSLKAMMMVLKVHKELGIRVSLAQVFKHPQIREMLTVQEENAVPYISLQPVEEKDYYETSPAQERLFILQQMIRDNTSYNIPIIQELTGKLDIKKFAQIFTQILIRHEILRTSFQLHEGHLIQRVHNYKELEFKIEFFTMKEGGDSSANDHMGLPAEREQDLIRRFIRPFDLSCAPLFRVGIIQDTNDRHILMVDFHHIVSDVVSHSLLIRDFE
ncbi:MAG: amino acid adenylation domain-containing protein, partial [Acidobacteria bacterium]|nr:amino acid adenylation domain-containing protein [Acidobacteriota bacterium]